MDTFPPHSVHIAASMMINVAWLRSCHVLLRQTAMSCFLLL